MWSDFIGSHTSEQCHYQETETGVQDAVSQRSSWTATLRHPSGDLLRVMAQALQRTLPLTHTARWRPPNAQAITRQLTAEVCRAYWKKVDSFTSHLTKAARRPCTAAGKGACEKPSGQSELGAAAPHGPRPAT
jgi:hypothetical protein